MGKLDTLIKGLKITQDSLNVLDQFVDVDRLIGISNAQGPQAKLIRAILEIDPDDFADGVDVEDFVRPLVRALPSKRSTKKPASKQKKLPSK